ncbi:MAG: hypothetical protein ACTH2U_17845 [Brevibacterium sp.]|uniref:Uncharacterized protein n=1 Tax=Brachybacterium tyrofermentans TaxID=47848 RepID=A0ABW0FJB6_9MICO
MHLTPDMADSFGDRLERDLIQHGLVSARPELADAMVPDEHRPLLRIRRPGAGMLIVARVIEGAAARWVIGVPGEPSPTLLDADSPDDAVAIVLAALDGASRGRHGNSPADTPG